MSSESPLRATPAGTHPPYLYPDYKSTPARADLATSYECQVSSYDWYGNSRPIFFRDRVFALIGHEMIEGAVAGGRILESARLNLTGSREHQR